MPIPIIVFGSLLVGGFLGWGCSLILGLKVVWAAVLGFAFTAYLIYTVIKAELIVRKHEKTYFSR